MVEPLRPIPTMKMGRRILASGGAGPRRTERPRLGDFFSPSDGAALSPGLPGVVRSSTDCLSSMTLPRSWLCVCSLPALARGHASMLLASECSNSHCSADEVDDL